LHGEGAEASFDFEHEDDEANDELEPFGGRGRKKYAVLSELAATKRSGNIRSLSQTFPIMHL
jgi:hypothetical protein